MIIEKQEDATRAVLEEMRRTPDARTHEILSALVRHLHAFVREVKLTEREHLVEAGESRLAVRQTFGVELRQCRLGARFEAAAIEGPGGGRGGPEH